MKVQTYINEGPGRFEEYLPSDPMVLGPVVETITPQGVVETMDVAENVYEIGNGMAADLNGDPWPSTVRSLSVGDVIVIGETAYAIDRIGWITLNEFRPVVVEPVR